MTMALQCTAATEVGFTASERSLRPWSRLAGVVGVLGVGWAGRGWDRCGGAAEAVAEKPQRYADQGEGDQE
ncbi:MAG: hypothetical protein QOH50_2154, partial [Kribbellaceae bacterium]|nr:hypothetical protein [Kribbellaceae bacterium]